MKTIALLIITFGGYLIAYHTYGRFLARKIFRLNPATKTPSEALKDGFDFVPTRKGIIFGHHYTSIAGTGPIVGPAIGIIWGWVPALIWIFFGSIFMGAVHDMSAVVISMRNRGLSISECASEYLGQRVKYIFFAIVFILLMIVIAVFGIVIAAIFQMYPQAVFPVWMQIPIAIALGWGLYKRGGNVKLLTAAAVFLMYVTIVLGKNVPVTMPDAVGIPSTGVWVIILLAYAFVASSLPVTTLLQPRDYINAWQLFIAMFLLVAGILGSAVFGGLEIVAPAYNPVVEGAPPMLPFLFITIACGAISGFHALVGSGTTSKQIEKEPDAQFVGYGSMLLEAALATLVIIAVAAGIGMAYETSDGILTGSAAWNKHYASWAASQGLGSKIAAMMVGSANMIETVGISREIGIVIMGVFIASFAGTTLDSATRIQRYVVSEVASDLNIKVLKNRFLATAFAVITAAWLAFSSGVDGKGALKIWPMFGAANQLLAALALIVATVFLKRKTRYGWLVAGIPAVVMLVVTLWAVWLNEMGFITRGQWSLAVINGAVMVLSAWIVLEGIVMLRSSKSATSQR